MGLVIGLGPKGSGASPSPTPVKIETDSITELTKDQLDALQVGDVVVKITGTDRHLYLVTYKAEEGGGICLSYFDASTVETVSYDRTESGWAYNSTDITNIDVTIVTSVSALSTDEEVPSAKCLYTMLGDVESILATI